MTRRRLAVALLLPEPVATEIDGLRRACGDPMLDAVAPHVTLVSPVNVRGDDLGAALATVRTAAAAVSGPLHVHLGPAASFEPVTSTLYLAVNGDLDAVEHLRRAVSTGPLARESSHPFHPHVTVCIGRPAAHSQAAVGVLDGYRREASIERLTVLTEERATDGARVWRPWADVVLGPPMVVGTGGFALDVSHSRVAEPAVADLLAVAPGPQEDMAILVSVRHDDAVVGAALVRPSGPIWILDRLVAATPSRGVGTRLVTEVARVAGAGGGEVLVAGPSVPEGFVMGLGWRDGSGSPVLEGWWRPL